MNVWNTYPSSERMENGRRALGRVGEQLVKQSTQSNHSAKCRKEIGR